jgi:hypothetical protein
MKRSDVITLQRVAAAGACFKISAENPPHCHAAPAAILQLGLGERCLMRLGVVICSLLLTGCVQSDAAPPNVVVKTVTKVVVKKVPAEREIVKVYIDKCPPKDELKAHCKQFRRDKDACEAEQRCQWVKADPPYCRSIHCKPEGKPFPREKRD